MKQSSVKENKPSSALSSPLCCCSLAVKARVMCSNTFPSSVAAVQSMMAWQTWSQMVHLGAPEAACWQDTHVTQETLLSSASASDTPTKHLHLRQVLFTDYVYHHSCTLWMSGRLLHVPEWSWWVLIAALKELWLILNTPISDLQTHAAGSAH